MCSLRTWSIQFCIQNSQAVLCISTFHYSCLFHKVIDCMTISEDSLLQLRKELEATLNEVCEVPVAIVVYVLAKAASTLANYLQKSGMKQLTYVNHFSKHCVEKYLPNHDYV